MAQTVSVLIISNFECETISVIHYIPREDDVQDIANENELYGDIECEYASYNIGDGESHTDSFFTDEDLVEMFEHRDGFTEFEKKIESMGYTIELFSSGIIRVNNEEEE